MKTLLNNLFVNRDAWSHDNLKPVYLGYIPPHSRFGPRINDKLYEKFMDRRKKIKRSEIRHKQSLWLKDFASNHKNTTATPD